MSFTSARVTRYEYGQLLLQSQVLNRLLSKGVRCDDLEDYLTFYKFEESRKQLPSAVDFAEKRDLNISSCIGLLKKIELTPEERESLLQRIYRIATNFADYLETYGRDYTLFDVVADKFDQLKVLDLFQRMLPLAIGSHAGQLLLLVEGYLHNFTGEARMSAEEMRRKLIDEKTRYKQTTPAWQQGHGGG